MIYFIQNKESNTVKIGYSKDKNGIYKRLKLFQCGNSSKLEITKIIEGSYADEANLHKLFWEYHANGEWYFIKGKLKEYLISKKTKEKSILKWKTLYSDYFISERKNDLISIKSMNILVEEI